MAVALERFIKEKLESLPPDHRDRGYLKGLLAITESYLERAGHGGVVSGSVDQAVEAYQSQLHTPELITQVHRAIWSGRGKLVGMDFEVSPCPYTQKELAALEQQGKRVGYLPEELATQQNRHILGEMFPQMRSYSVQEGNPVTNDGNPSGWFDYEKGDAPYLGTDEEEFKKRITEEGRVPLSLNQYIVAGWDSELFTGRYLDEETWVRLGSRYEGRVVDAYFGRDGYLTVGRLLRSGDRYRDLGGRSSGVKKT